MGLPRWLSGKESACQCRRLRKHSSILGSGRSSGGGTSNLLQYSRLDIIQRSLEGYSPRGGKESDTTEHTHTSEMSYGVCLFLIYFTLYDNLQVHQPWIFIRRTSAEAQAPTLWPPDAKTWLIGKDPDAGKDWRPKEKRVAEDEMVRQHHQLNGYDLEQTPGDSGEQESLVCWSPCGHKESDMT